MKKTVITADSTFDMPPEMIRALDIRVIASYVVLGEKQLPDYPDITQKDLFAFYQQTRTLPKTAAANPGEYAQFFSGLAGEDHAVIHIAKSSGISSCCANAALAAADLPNVYVIDSENLSGGSAMLAIEAARLADSLPPEELCAHLNAWKKRIDGNFVIESLEYLQKGGRCSALALMGANLLQLRPEIVIRDGSMTVGKKYRGTFERVLFNYLDDKLKNLPAYETDMAYICHTVTDPALLERLVNYVKDRKIFREVIEYPASSAISCHCGPNTFGMFCQRKN